MFWQSHNPIGSPRGSQYKSAIWFASDDQLEIINASIETLHARFNRDLTTEVLPMQTFYNAEDYHQKYSLQRHRRLMDIFHSMYPEFRGFVDSTSAARLNGFVAGRGSSALFEAEKHQYGFELTELEKIVRP